MRGNDGLLVLLLLLALSGGSQAAAPPRRLPAGKRNPGFDVYEEPSDAELMKPPEEPSDDDLLWSRYVGDTSHAHPAHVDDRGPVVRKLSRFERWALAPYFIPEDLEPDLYLGKASPRLLEQLRVALRSPSLTEAEALAFGRRLGIVAATRADGICFPTVPPLYSRWWLGALGHELAHHAQYRMGATPEQALDAMREHGYQNSPIEVQARHVQRQVLRGLTTRARNFYREKGEL